MKNVNLLPSKEIPNVRNKKIFYQIWLSSLFLTVVILIFLHRFLINTINADRIILKEDKKKLIMLHQKLNH